MKYSLLILALCSAQVNAMRSGTHDTVNDSRKEMSAWQSFYWETCKHTRAIFCSATIFDNIADETDRNMKEKMTKATKELLSAMHEKIIYQSNQNNLKRESLLKLDYLVYYAASIDSNFSSSKLPQRLHTLTVLNDLSETKEEEIKALTALLDINKFSDLARRVIVSRLKEDSTYYKKALERKYLKKYENILSENLFTPQEKPLVAIINKIREAQLESPRNQVQPAPTAMEAWSAALQPIPDAGKQHK